MERRLGIFETAETLTDAAAPFNVVGVVEIEPGIGPIGLREALDRAQRRHPLLRAKIVDDDGGFAYDLDDVPPIPLEIVDRKGDDHWLRVAETELNRSFDIATGPLARCSLLTDGSGAGASELVVCFLHTIIDGTSAVNLVREILEAWDAAAAGRSMGEPQALALQPPVESFFPAAYRGFGAKIRTAGFMARQLADELGYRRRARGTRRMPIHARSHCRALSRELADDDLVAVVRAARRHRVTLNSALNAAMLTVVRDRLYDGAPVPLRNFNFAILRPYLDPPVEDHHLGSYHVMLRPTVNLRADDDVWRLAERINTLTVIAARRGDKYLSLLTVADVMRFILSRGNMRMGSTALGYTGPLKLPESIGAIAIRAVHALVSNFVLGPEFTAQARLFRGRLCWDTVYLDSDMDESLAAGITDEILDLLREVGREPR
jgi:hypothetical protein